MTYTEEQGLIEHITVWWYYNASNIHVMTRLIPDEGYALHYKYEETVDEEGNPIEPLYSYNLYLPAAANIYDYEAVLIVPGMEVVGKPNDTEIM